MYTENTNPPENQNQFDQPNINMPPMGQIPVPNASTILILGIVSIVLACCCYGIVGLILAIVTVVMAKKAKEIYFANPNAYTPGSLSNINAGRICAIIAIVLGAITVICYIFLFSIFGFSVLTDPSAMQDIFQQRM